MEVSQPSKRKRGRPPKHGPGGAAKSLKTLKQTSGLGEKRNAKKFKAAVKFNNKIKIKIEHKSDEGFTVIKDEKSSFDRTGRENLALKESGEGFVDVKQEVEVDEDMEEGLTTSPIDGLSVGGGYRKKRKKEREYSCHQCDKVFTRRYRLTAHMRSHDGIKKFRCVVCGKMFGRNDHVLRHMQKKHHDLEEYKCDICDSRFTVINEIIAHVTKHMQESEKTEDVLLSGLSDQHKEQSYAAVGDNGLREFGCRICDKKFSKPYKLRDHLDVHLGIKTDCPECGMQFDNRSLMGRHFSKTHRKAGKDGETLQCPQCKKKYRDGNVFELHLSNCERRFKCDQCVSEFYTSNHLKRHTENVHERVGHKCELCDKVFTTKFRRDEHVRVVHEGKAKSSKSFICHICGLSYEVSYVVCCSFRPKNKMLKVSPSLPRLKKFEYIQCK